MYAIDMKSKLLEFTRVGGNVPPTRCYVAALAMTSHGGRVQ